MNKVTVSITDEHVERLEAVQEDQALDSRSATLRHVLNEYARLQAEYDELHTEYEELQTRLEQRENRIAELEEQLARRSQIEEKVDVLANRVEEQQDKPPWPLGWFHDIRSYIGGNASPT